MSAYVQEMEEGTFLGVGHSDNRGDSPELRGPNQVQCAFRAHRAVLAVNNGKIEACQTQDFHHVWGIHHREDAQGGFTSFKFGFEGVVNHGLCLLL